jgi:SAM-dependent methyltransferase
MEYLLIFVCFGLYVFLANFYSYTILKTKLLRSQKWDLNICCGKTDGGGVNADIFKHLEVHNFVYIKDIYNLPFENNQFDSVLCSHTMEHIDDPELFFTELSRVGKEVTIVIPPLYDIVAVLNFLEHKWIFLSFKKKHNTLPTHIQLPFSRMIQKFLGQRLRA